MIMCRGREKHVPFTIRKLFIFHIKIDRVFVNSAKNRPKANSWFWFVWILFCLPNLAFLAVKWPNTRLPMPITDRLFWVKAFPWKTKHFLFFFFFGFVFPVFTSMLHYYLINADCWWRRNDNSTGMIIAGKGF